MKIKKLLLLILLLGSLFVVASCSGKDEFENHWEKFVNAINDKNIEEVANLTFFNTATKTSFLNQYRDGETPEDYFAGIDGIATNSFEIDVYCDISSTAKKDIYASANVNATITLNGSPQEVEFTVYGNVEADEWYFCNQVVYLTGEALGNQPSQLWSTNVYYTTEDGLIYKIEGTGTNLYAVIYDYDAKQKNVVIPDEIDGYPVTTIYRYSFYKKTGFLNITYPTSKLESIAFSKSVTRIDEYAFYQAKKLKEVVFPSNITEIASNAFTSCTRLEKITFEVNDDASYDELEKVESVLGNNSSVDIVINNARNMYIGDIITLEGVVTSDTVQDKSLRWTSSSDTIATVDGRGNVTAVSNGTVTITATLIEGDNTFNCATVVLTVGTIPQIISINSTAFDRCSGLKEMHLNTFNPLSIAIPGTGMKLSEDVQIFVPKGSGEMYRLAWSAYAEQIVEQE